MKLSDPITVLPGVGNFYATKLARLNLLSLSDLLNHFPTRYLDYGHPTEIGQLIVDKEQCIRATLKSKALVRTRRGQKMLVAKFADKSAKIGVLWFNQDYLLTSLKEDEEYFLAGKPSFDKGGRLNFISPILEPIERGGIFTTGIVPIYPLTEGISSRFIQHKLNLILQSVSLPDEFLSPTQLADYGLVELRRAYIDVHQPKQEVDYQAAQKRFAFNQLLTLHLRSALNKHRWSCKVAHPIISNTTTLTQFERSLPFDLTIDQKQALEEIRLDMSAGVPMNRLLQGDVGAGKTVVAAAAILATLKAGYKAILLAPTQVLASQHFETLNQMLSPFGISPELVTSSTKPKSAALLVGTHAVLHRDKLIDQTNLGLVVIDEQHRFGVLQRSKFATSKSSPHILTMSATPIPRTIALAVYGHLDLSFLKTKPGNRMKIKTWVVTEAKRSQAMAWVKKELKRDKTQAFIVCPFVDESDKDTLKNIKAATTEYQKIKRLFAGLKVQLLHGRLSNSLKTTRLKNFAARKFDVLVTTPVVEVGVDIPRATIMIIEDADRFGLAQLHQLRGRVGRNDRQSYCLLFATQAVNPRLRLLETTTDGLKLAEADLKFRGAGQLFGTAQSGHLDFTFAYIWDKNLKQGAKVLASELIRRPAYAQKLLNSLDSSLAKSEVGN